MEPLDLDKMRFVAEVALNTGGTMYLHPSDVLRMIRMSQRRTEALQILQEKAHNARENAPLLLEQPERGALLTAWSTVADIVGPVLTSQGEEK